MCKKSLKKENETELHPIPYRQVVKRGCEYCMDMGVIRKMRGGTLIRGCPHQQCPYHELDKYKSYTEYLKKNPLHFNKKKGGKAFFVTVNGRTQNLSQWAREIGVSKSTVYGRIKSGMTPLEAIGFFGYDENDENE